jgi:hypothetical protein
MKKTLGTARVAMALGVAIGSLLLASGVSNASARPRTLSVTHGIDTFFDYRCQTTKQIDGWATTQFKAFKALGANSVGIAFPLYTQGLRSNAIYAKTVCGYKSTFESPTPGILASVIGIAHANGLTVLLRPLLDEKVIEESNPKDYRGSIRPSNVSTWFNNYLTTLYPYLVMAQKNGVESFSVSGELNSLASAPEWPSAIVKIHKIYKGTQVFTFSFNQQIGKVLKTGTLPGMDTYPITDVSTKASPATLVTTWDNYLKTKQYRVPSPISAITIDEIGIPAQNGAYRQPSAHDLSLKQYPFNQMIQVNWYTAACTFVKQHDMSGVYFWGSYLTENDGRLLKSPSAKAPQNMQPLSQQVIKQCFA